MSRRGGFVRKTADTKKKKKCGCRFNSPAVTVPFIKTDFAVRLQVQRLWRPPRTVPVSGRRFVSEMVRTSCALPSGRSGFPQTGRRLPPHSSFFSRPFLVLTPLTDPSLFHKRQSPCPVNTWCAMQSTALPTKNQVS